MRAKEMARSIKCLPCKQENLSLIPRPALKKIPVGVNFCNMSTGEAETGGAMGLASRSPSPLGKLLASK